MSENICKPSAGVGNSFPNGCFDREVLFVSRLVGKLYLVEGFRLRVCLATGSQMSMSAVRRVAPDISNSPLE